MKLIGRIAIGLAALAAIVVIGLFVFTKFYFTSEKLREIVEPRLTEAVGREITLGKLDFNLFSGLEVAGFAVRERAPFGQADFVACDSLVFKYDLFSLLTGNLSISRVALIAPRLEVIRDEKGRFNFQDIADRQGGKEGEEAGEAPEEDDGPVSVTISSVEIRDGRVVYRDLASGQSLTLEKIELLARDIAPGQPFSLDLGLVFNDVPVKIVGQAAPGTKSGQFKLTTGKLDLARVDKLIPETSPVRPSAGLIQAEVQINLTGGEALAAQGTVSGSRLSLTLPDQGLDYRDVDLKAYFQLKAYPEREMISIASANLKIGPASFNLSGRAAPGGFDITFEAPEQDLAPLKALMPAKADYPVTGGRATLRLKAASTDPKQEIDFDLTAAISELTLAEGDAGPLKPLTMSLTATGRARPHKSLALLKALTVTGPGIDLAASGTVGEKIISLVLSRLNIDLATASSQGPFLAPYQAAGRINAGLKVNGDPNKPESIRLDGKATLSGVRLSGGSLPQPLSLDGVMTLKGQDLSGLKMTGALGESKFTVTGRGSKLTTSPDVVFNLRVDQADVAQLTPPPAKGGAQIKKAEGDADREPEGMNIPLTARGQIRVGQLKYRLVKLKDVLVDYVLKDNVLTLGRVGGKIWPVGDLAGNLALDLGKQGYGYKGALSLAKAEMASVAGSFLGPQVGEFSGLGWLEASFNGAGIRFPNLWKNLTARFKTNMTGGRIKANPQLTKVSEFLGVPELKDYSFDRWKGDFAINKGLLDVDSAIASKIIPAKFKGALGLAGQNSDLAADLKIAPDLITSGLAQKVVGVLPRDDKGFAIVPLKLTGPLDGLNVGLNEAALAALAAEALKKKAGQQLQGVLGSDGDKAGEGASDLIEGLTGGAGAKKEAAPKAAADSSGSSQPSIGEAIKQTPLKKLFE